MCASARVYMCNVSRGVNLESGNCGFELWFLHLLTVQSLQILILGVFPLLFYFLIKITFLYDFLYGDMELGDREMIDR